MPVVTRVVCALTALAVLVGGSSGAVEIARALLGQPEWLIPHSDWSSWLRDQTWDATVVRAGLVGLALLGLLLLVAALRRGRPRAVALPVRPEHTPDGVTMTASRRSTEAWLAAGARRTNGVRAAEVKLGRRRAKVTVRTASRTEGTLGQDVTEVVQDRLTALGLNSRIRPRVTVSRQEVR